MGTRSLCAVVNPSEKHIVQKRSGGGLIWVNRVNEGCSGRNAFHHLHTSPSRCLKAAGSPSAPPSPTCCSSQCQACMCVRKGTWVLRSGIHVPSHGNVSPTHTHTVHPEAARDSALPNFPYHSGPR